jgi:hypothetical protein
MALKMTDLNIDDEWSKFLTNKYDDCSSDDENNNLHDELSDNDNTNDKEWDELSAWPMTQSNTSEIADYSQIKSNSISELSVPEPTDIYISTKSKIAYLTQPVDLNIFWDIPVISYSSPQNGVIKKQIKINSKTPEELDFVQQRLQKEILVDQHIMSHIDNPNGRIKFKDIRKITIGVSTKDIMSYRSKKKQAFYNCFVMILRLKINDRYREFHVKVFNTGKLEMPGVQSESMFQILLNHIISILQPFYSEPLTYSENSDTVLINSNFNCGFYINREVLYDILRSKYNIQAIYDPCSYPGIQCKFYYNNDVGVQTGMQITTENKDKYKNITEVSFMIFRTGSVLIVGMCEEFVLQDIYTFLKALLKTEFKYICQKIITNADLLNKDKKKKIRRKTINIVTGVPEVENKKYEEHLENIVLSKQTQLQILETSEEIHDSKPEKKQRKPRKSKKAVNLEIVEEV